MRPFLSATTKNRPLEFANLVTIPLSQGRWDGDEPPSAWGTPPRLEGELMGNYARKIENLTDRRQGRQLSKGMAFDSATLEAFAGVRKQEKFVAIAEPEAVKYAIGAMQAVDVEYTQKSYEEGNRVRDQLLSGLNAAGTTVEFDYQGSVPLDVHVRGNSDIDLLVLHDGFVTVDQAASAKYNYTTLGGSATDELKTLREQCIDVLSRRYWGANVDTSSSKAIALSGGSLRREIDVIPSHWHDTLEWKQTRDKRYRDIYILDSKKGERIKNRPFMHIALVSEKCQQFRGSLRKVIRLLKNLRYDADTDIGFSSYDIAALAWHMQPRSLTVPFGCDLLLVENAREFTSLVLDNPTYRNGLWVPDGSRLIFDDAKKVNALIALHKELEELSSDLAREIDPAAALLQLRPRAQILNKTVYL
jgi:hypothetical protein